MLTAPFCNRGFGLWVKFWVPKHFASQGMTGALGVNSWRDWLPHQKSREIYLEPQTTSFYWMFAETTISYVKIWNHQIETTMYKWIFGVHQIGSQFHGPVSFWIPWISKKNTNPKNQRLDPPKKGVCLTLLFARFFWISKPPHSKGLKPWWKDFPESHPFGIVRIVTPKKKQTGKSWKIHHLKIYFLFKIVIFQYSC